MTVQNTLQNKRLSSPKLNIGSMKRQNQTFRQEQT